MTRRSFIHALLAVAVAPAALLALWRDGRQKPRLRRVLLAARDDVWCYDTGRFHLRADAGVLQPNGQPALRDGDPVGCWLDQSGHGNHFT